MPHDLERSKDLAPQVHAILLEQIEDAASVLAAARPSEKAIHDARKSLKKARATIRLLRENIPDDVYRRENRALRDVARPLSSARDASVMLATLDKLVKLYGEAAADAIPAPLRKALKEELTQAGRTLRGSMTKKLSPSRSATTVKRRLARARVSESGWRSIGTALRRVYRRGRRAMKEARRTPTAECLHEWRKQTKHLWHQTQVLEPLWPAMIAEFGDQAHKLADYLGDDHDLAVLREKLKPEAFKHSGNADALLAIIDRCRAQLQEKAFLLGGRIYDASPAEFVAQYERWWERWRTEQAL